MRIFDCFIFNHEVELLEIRMNILNDYVDKFVITEEGVTEVIEESPKTSFFKYPSSGIALLFCEFLSVTII